MPTHQLRETFDGSNVSTFSHSVTVPNNPDQVMIVIVRHGDGTENHTHNQVTADGVNMTQLGSIFDMRGSDNRRRWTMWKLVGPNTGTINVAGGFSATVAQYSVTVLVASDAADPTNFTTTVEQATGTTMTTDITPDDAGSLIYAGANASAIDTDPFAPTGDLDVEVEDSDDHSATTNHEFATGYGDVVSEGVAQTMGFTSSATAEWGAWAIELPPAADDRITGRSVDIDFPTHTVTIESGV